MLETKNAHLYRFNANELQNRKPHKTSKSGKKKPRQKKKHSLEIMRHIIMTAQKWSS
jgi:hypothetical protein